jgi:CubicO group peptidase (beta-lactamase class C family)
MAGLILAAVAMAGARASMFPGAEWEQRSPESQGMDSARLLEALEYAAGPQQLRSHCASIHRNGFVVAEGYWKPGQAFANATTMVYSVSKTFVTTMVGAAERDGLVDTEREAHTYGIPQWLGTDAQGVTVDMLLRHDSGRYYGSDLEDIGLPQFLPAGTDPSSQTQYAISLNQEYYPGTVTEYNQMAFQTLERVLRNATNKPATEYVAEKVFEPLGFQYSPFLTELGVVTNIRNGPLMYAGINCACRDLARFGTLWMNFGTWGDGVNGTETTEIFTEEFWRKSMSAPRGGRAYHWVRNGDSYQADGMGGQFVLFNAELGLVVTREGNVLDEWVESFSPATFINMVMSAFTRAEDKEKASRWSLAYARADEEAGEQSLGNPAAEQRFWKWIRSQQQQQQQQQ